MFSRKSVWDYLDDQPYLLDPEDQDIGEVLGQEELHRDLEKEWRQDVYYDYLQTSYWQRVKSVIKNRANNRCEVCKALDPGGTKTLQIHHFRYPERFTELEHLEDLILVCVRCHEQLHGA